MTTGQIMFYGGIGLVALALLLLIVFMIKKPKYVPENAVYDASANKPVRDQHAGQHTSAAAVQGFENGSNVSAASQPAAQETTVLPANSEETVPLTEVPEETPETVPLAQETEILEGASETVPLAPETEVLTEA